MYQIFDIMGRRSPVKIIKLFLRHPTAEFYETQVREKTRLAKAGVNKWLKELERCGLLLGRRHGRMIIYKLNTGSEAVRHLKIMATLDVLQHKLADIKDAQVYLFGSSALGTDTESSDIDILVISKDRNLIQKIRKIDDKIKVSFFTPVEWSMAARKDPSFYENVEKNKIRLV